MSILLSLQIDILFVYNQDALEELGSISTSQMETMLAAEVEEVNDILVNSEIDLEFVLAHAQEVRVFPVVYRKCRGSFREENRNEYGVQEKSFK